MIRIQIIKPCDANWDDMTPNEKGRFCAACQKHVIDFTQFSDTEVADFMLQNDNVCGRFQTKQLDKTYPYLSSLTNFSTISIWKQKILAIAMLLGINTPLVAQTDSLNKITLQGHVIDKKTQTPILNTLLFLYEIQADGKLIECGYKKADEKAMYSFDVERDKQYKILASATGFPTNDIFISTQNLSVNHDIQEVILIEKDIILAEATECYTLGGAEFIILPRKKKWFSFWKK